MRTRIVECVNGWVTTTTLPVGELCPTPFGFSRIASEVARTPRRVRESEQRNSDPLIPFPEGNSHD